MRRVFAALVALVIVAAWAGTARPVRASCAETATLEESAAEPGAAVFTGRATSELPESGDVSFAVDRWFEGLHAEPVVRLLGSSVTLAEPPSADMIPVTLARTVSGEAITIVRDEPVLLVAAWAPESDAFVPQPCSLGAVPLDSEEGRDALTEAIALFGPGVAAADLPSTDTLRPDGAEVTIPPRGVGDPQLLVLVIAFAAGFLLVTRRTDEG